MKPCVLIPAAGGPRPQVLSISSRIRSAAMVPVNGKPVIGWILDEMLLGQGLTNLVILKSQHDRKLEEYIEKRGILARYVETEEPEMPKGLAHSLFKGIQALEGEDILTDDILILLGHTILLGQQFRFDEDWVMYSAVTEEAARWCYVDVDDQGYVRSLVDKPETRDLPDKALIGAYYLQDRELLFECLKATIRSNKLIGGEFQLSTALQSYISWRRLKAQPCIGEWLDCGSIAGLHRSKRRLISTRSFNAITVDTDIGILTKTSANSAHLHQEYSWYISLPTELIGLAPRVIEYRPSHPGVERAGIALEYYGYNSLEEAWVYQNLSEDAWLATLGHLLTILRKFRKYRAWLPQEAFTAMYWDKTQSRLGQLRGHEPWDSLLAFETLWVNDDEISGYPKLEKPLRTRICSFYNEDHITIIHGDFHLANILYDLNSRLIKLIDPRGSFGASGIFGDCKYDFAKLRHSISGGYNFIINDLFDVSCNGNKLTLDVSRNEHQERIVEWFDRELEQEGFDVEDVKIIEGLLFLSMLPIHADHPERQLAMFGKAMTILNEAISP